MPRDLTKTEGSVSVTISEIIFEPAPWGRRRCRSDAC